MNIDLISIYSRQFPNETLGVIKQAVEFIAYLTTKRYNRVSSAKANSCKYNYVGIVRYVLQQNKKGLLVTYPLWAAERDYRSVRKAFRIAEQYNIPVLHYERKILTPKQIIKIGEIWKRYDEEKKGKTLTQQLQQNQKSPQQL